MAHSSFYNPYVPPLFFPLYTFTLFTSIILIPSFSIERHLFNFPPRTHPFLFPYSPSQQSLPFLSFFPSFLPLYSVGPPSQFFLITSYSPRLTLSLFLCFPLTLSLIYLYPLDSFLISLYPLDSFLIYLYPLDSFLIFLYPLDSLPYLSLSP